MRGAEPAPKRHVTAPPAAAAPLASRRPGRLASANGARPGTLIPRVPRAAGGRKRPRTVAGWARKPSDTSALTASRSRPRACLRARRRGDVEGEV